jgi:hypothetical protein
MIIATLMGCFRKARDQMRRFVLRRQHAGPKILYFKSVFIKEKPVACGHGLGNRR